MFDAVGGLIADGGLEALTMRKLAERADVAVATLYNQFGGLIPGGGGVVLTGPGFVTADNAEAVIELSAEGIR